MIIKYKNILVAMLVAFALLSCDGWRESGAKVDKKPEIFPDYMDVTVPCNIAPLNFDVDGATHVQAEIKAGEKTLRVSGKKGVAFSVDEWRDLVDAALKDKDRKIEIALSAWTDKSPEGTSFKPFFIKVSPDTIDRYLVYRLIAPGYESWNHMGIYRRDLSTFSETAIVENTQNNMGCVNCHSFADYNVNRGMMFHARGKGGGTVVYHGGSLHKIALEKLAPYKSATYPCWHPSGRYIVFSSNTTRQSFYGHSRDKIEVYDQKSDIILYNVERNEVFADERFNDSINWETFPYFSADGKWLFFATAKAVKMPVEYNNLRYSLCRVAFDEDRGRFGSVVDTIYSATADGGSASFPRLSPDGRYLLFTRADCATFPIHHKEADLRMIDLGGKEPGREVDVSVLNSNDVDSYHSWSSTGRWVVLSSKRIDGRHTRLFLSHFDGRAFSKPLLLPQREPSHNTLRTYSYNIPEFSKNMVTFDRDELSNLFRP